MKTLIVGDVHGKVHVVERALAQEHPVTFIGDYLDSFDRTIEDHLKCMELIFAAIDAGKAKALYGNHELSYLIPKMSCSGYNPKMAKYVDAIPSGDGAPSDTRFEGGLRKQMADRFVSFLFYEPNILLTHGGLDKRIWDQYNLTLTTLPQALAEWSNDVDSPAYWIGRSRGGIKPCGGIFWCDFEREFHPIPGLIQIVGHTRGQKLRTIGTENFCIDYNDYLHDLFYFDLPTDEGEVRVQEPVV